MTSPDQTPKAESTPTAPATPTPPVPVVKKPMLPPQKGFRGFQPDNSTKFRPKQSGAIRFIQARRAPGK